MRIKKINLSGFGRFRDFQLDLTEPFTILGGRNEVGKTTMVNAIAAVLFGFTGPRRELLHRYAPWQDPKNYRASILLAASDGTEYLVGRDFANGRIEVFRCEGIRLEAVGEKFLQEMLNKELGITNPLLFEHTLLIREKEVSLLEQDPRSRGGLSQILGSSLSGQGGAATFGEACHNLETNLDSLVKGNETFPEGIEGLRSDLISLQGQLTEAEQSFLRYQQINEEYQRIQEEILEKQKIESELELKIAELDNREDLGKALEDVSERIVSLSREYDRLNRLREEEKHRIEQARDDTFSLSEGDLVRCEEILNRLSIIEVEEKYRRDQVQEAQKNVATLEKEAESLREKIRNMGEGRSDTDQQTKISNLLMRVNECQRKLLDQAKAPKGSNEAPRPLLRNILILAFIASGAGTVGIYLQGLIPAYLYGAIGVTGTFAVALMIASIVYQRKRKNAQDDESEHNQIEEELFGYQDEISQLLNGKTIEEYQSENQIYRLYQNDLWHLEHTIAQQKQIESTEDITAIQEEAMNLRTELSNILEQLGDIPPYSWRETVEQQRYRRSLAANNNTSLQSELDVEMRSIQEEMERAKAEESELKKRCSEDDGLSLKQQEHERLHSEISQLQIEIVRIETELKVHHDHEPKDTWELLSKVEEKKAQLEALTLDEEATRLAIEFLREAGGHSEEQIGPVIERLAGEYLACMTQQRYSQMTLKTVDDEFIVQVQSPETGDWINPNVLSAGTLDEVYLSFRFALADVVTKSPHYFLLLDDPFTHFDRERLEGAISLLKRISEMHQIIWWTKDAKQARELTGIEPTILPDI